MTSGIAQTKAFTVTPTSQMILGKDPNRLELTIFNLSETDKVFIGFGSEVATLTVDDMMPLEPGEVYDASIPVVSAVYLASSSTDVETVIYYSSGAPGYVSGVLNG